MVEDKYYTPRFSFEITEDQKTRAARVLGVFGTRRAIFSKILDDVLDMVEFNGPGSIGVLLSGAAKPREILPSLYQAEEAGKNGQP
jgi:hypothetical protein